MTATAKAVVVDPENDNAERVTMTTEELEALFHSEKKRYEDEEEEGYWKSYEWQPEAPEIDWTTGWCNSLRSSMRWRLFRLLVFGDVLTRIRAGFSRMGPKLPPSIQSTRVQGRSRVVGTTDLVVHAFNALSA